VYTMPKKKNLAIGNQELVQVPPIEIEGADPRQSGQQRGVNGSIVVCNVGHLGKKLRKRGDQTPMRVQGPEGSFGDVQNQKWAN